MVIAGVYTDFKHTKSHLNKMAVRQLFSHDLAKAKHETINPEERFKNREDNLPDQLFVG